MNTLCVGQNKVLSFYHKIIYYISFNYVYATQTLLMVKAVTGRWICYKRSLFNLEPLHINLLCDAISIKCFIDWILMK